MSGQNPKLTFRPGSNHHVNAGLRVHDSLSGHDFHG
jgi:hypothetical protein